MPAAVLHAWRDCGAWAAFWFLIARERETAADEQGPASKPPVAPWPSPRRHPVHDHRHDHRTGVGDRAHEEALAVVRGDVLVTLPTSGLRLNLEERYGSPSVE